MSEDILTIPEVTIDIDKELEKPRLIAFLFCEYGSVSNDGKPSAIGIFDRITIKPNGKHRFFMFVRLAGNVNKGEIQIFNPDGKIEAIALLQPLASVTPKSGEVTYLQALLVFVLEAAQEGLYWFKILNDGEDLGGNGIKVEFKKDEEQHGNSDDI